MGKSRSGVRPRIVPLVPTPEEPPRLVAHPPEGEAWRCRVLIVEDNADAAESLRALLELAGYAVDVAFDGQAALAQARTFRPDVVLCDIGLPGDMDGYALAAAFRRGTDVTPPHLIALTGYAQPADRDKAREAGFDHHVTKPADPAALKRILAEIKPKD